jgi:hypothetical protein
MPSCAAALQHQHPGSCGPRAASTVCSTCLRSCASSREQLFHPSPSLIVHTNASPFLWPPSAQQLRHPDTLQLLKQPSRSPSISILLHPPLPDPHPSSTATLTTNPAHAASPRACSCSDSSFTPLSSSCRQDSIIVCASTELQLFLFFATPKQALPVAAAPIKSSSRHRQLRCQVVIASYVVKLPSSCWSSSTSSAAESSRCSAAAAAALPLRYIAKPSPAVQPSCCCCTVLVQCCRHVHFSPSPAVRLEATVGRCLGPTATSSFGLCSPAAAAAALLSSHPNPAVQSSCHCSVVLSAPAFVTQPQLLLPRCPCSSAASNFQS